MSLANWTTRLLVGAKDGDVPTQAPGGDASAAGAVAPSLVGSRIGAYQITKRLGAGGVGEVFKGVDTMLNRDVAIKVLRDELAADPHFLARFRNEAQLHGKLNHPNVASVHAFVQEGDKQFLVMEYVAGVSLDEFVRAGGPVPVARALAIFRRALDGVDHAHGHGIVHRDIKPANIMLADSGQVKVMDFGIARAMDSQEHLTRIGHVAGTAKAMSPEQIRGKQADVRSDVYSLGIVLYTLLAGRAPFEVGNDLELMKAQLEESPPPLRGAIDKVPAQVEAAVMRALEKDPAARFQTVRDFARAIDACIAGLGIAAPATGVRPGVAADTSSRTAINPVVQGAKRLPAAAEAAAHAAGAAARGDRSGPRWMKLGVISLAVVALGAGGAVVWSVLFPGEQAAGPSAGGRTAPTATAAATRTTEATTAGASPTGGTPAAATPPVDMSTPPTVSTATAAPSSITTTPAVPSASTDTAQVAEPKTRDPSAPAVAAVTAPPVRADAAMPPALSITRVGAAAAVQRFRPGERIELSIAPSRDAHVYCYLQDESRRILRFFPNRFRQSALVRSGEPLQIPGRMRFELVANTLRVTETVACFASDRDVWGELPPAVLGSDFERLAVGSLAELRSAFARAAGDSLAQASFQVQFK